MTTTSSTPPPSVSPTPDPVEQARSEVLAVYRTFMDARNKSLHDPTKRPDRRLDIVSTGAARSGVYSLSIFYRTRELAVHGSPISIPGVVQIQSGRERVAKFRDCLDSTDSFPIFAKTGKSALAPDQPRRVIIEVAAVEQGPKWLISTWLPRKGQLC
jgi:hypothetical protein